MTIIKLKNELEKLIAKGCGRKTVSINKQRVTHPLEDDGCCIIPVTSIAIEHHEMMDEDGGFKTRKNGDARYLTVLVIAAEC